MDSYEAILDGYRLLGRIIGETSLAEKGIGAVEKRLARVRERIAGRTAPRTFVEIGFRPLVTATKGCAVDDVLQFAGARNVAAGLGSGYPRVDMETILALDPEVVLLTTMTGVNPQEKARWMEFEGCSAVRDGRIFTVNGDDLCRPDPIAFAAAVEAIARLVHPDAFRE
jgi:iron complex transport system substrate-binding protein